MRRLTRSFYALVALLLVIPLTLVILYRFVPPVSTLMLLRWVTFQPVSRTFVPLDAIAPALPRAVIASEDARFCQHGGVDWDALREVIEEADEDGPSRGASTITMQTARNVFLWQGRSYLRKALEIPLALAIERHLVETPRHGGLSQRRRMGRRHFRGGGGGPASLRQGRGRVDTT